MVFHTRYSWYQGNRKLFYLGDGGHLMNEFETFADVQIDGSLRDDNMDYGRRNEL